MTKNNQLVRILPLAGLLTVLSGCRVVGDIFKAGVWVGIIAVVLVVGLVLGAIRLVAR